jgi:hypothetical protein
MQVETGLKRVKMNDKETYIYITERGGQKKERESGVKKKENKNKNW